MDICSMKKSILTLITMFWLLQINGQNIHFVNQSATGNNDGSTWANAYTNLDSALLNAGIWDTIWVAKGIYKPGNGTNRNAWFDLKCATFGGFIGTETKMEQRDIKANETILSGDLFGNDNGNLQTTEITRADNVYTVCYFRGKTISGFTIEGGNSNGSSTYSEKGAAIYASGNFTGKIQDCTFRKNTAKSNVAIHFYRPKGLNSWLTIDRCKFENNATDNGLLGFSTNGTHGTYLHVFNSLFHHNYINNVDGVMFPLTLTNYGSTIRGALHFEFIHNTIAQNTIGTSGAIIGYAKNGAAGTSFHNAIIQNNIFLDHLAPFKEIPLPNNVSTSAFYFNYNIYGNTSLNTINTVNEQKFNNKPYATEAIFKDASNNDYKLKSCKSIGHFNATYVIDNNASQMDIDGNIRDSFVQDAGCYMITGIPKYNLERANNSLSIPSTRTTGYWFVDTLGDKTTYYTTAQTITPHKAGFFRALSQDTASKCHSISNLYNFNYLSTDEIKNNPLIIYPNPTSHYVNISPEWNESTFMVHDIKGNLVKKVLAYANESISLLDLPPGTYIITIQKSEAISRLKLIKN